MNGKKEYTFEMPLRFTTELDFTYSYERNPHGDSFTRSEDWSVSLPADLQMQLDGFMKAARIQLEEFICKEISILECGKFPKQWAQECPTCKRASCQCGEIYDNFRDEQERGRQ